MANQKRTRRTITFPRGLLWIELRADRARKDQISTTSRLSALLLSCLAAVLALPAAAEEPGEAEPAKQSLVLELNRIEPLPEACRLYLLLRNEQARGFERLTLDLVFFDRDAIIDRRFSVEAGPIAARKTTLRQLDVPDLSCEELGSLLLNAVPSCSGTSVSQGDCIALVVLKNRTDITFFK